MCAAKAGAAFFHDEFAPMGPASAGSGAQPYVLSFFLDRKGACGTKLTSDIGQSSRAPGYAAWTSLEPTKVASGVAATMAVPGLK